MFAGGTLNGLKQRGPSVVEKEAAARYGAALVGDGDLVGLGSGSTVDLLVRALGWRVAGGLRVRAIAASARTETLARSVGIEVVGWEGVRRLALALDGADEVDPRLALIKGGGGALVREKVIAGMADRFVVLVDSSKQVRRLGRRPVPIEVVPFAWRPVQTRLATWKVPSVLREQNGAPVVTDNAHYLLDASFGEIETPAELEARLNGIPGVVDCGLFVGLATEVVVGTSNVVRVLWPHRG